MNADVIEIGNYSQVEWKRLVNTKIREMNRDDILQQMKKPYKKISYVDHMDQELQLQPYLVSLNISDARLRFKLKTGMTPTVRMNFPSDPEFSRQLWTCPGCSEGKPDQDIVVGYRDTQTHILSCEGYEDLRENKDLACDKDLVTYFSLVIKKRLEIVK